MKKALILIGVLITLIAGWYLLSPLFFDKEVNESLEDLVAQHEADFGEVEGLKEIMGIESEPETQELDEPQPVPATVIGTGSFEGLERHNASGQTTIVSINDQTYIRLEDDFNVTNGPDLYVGFGKDGAYGEEVARLKGNIGGQNYLVPESVDVNEYNEVWIWCRAFSVPFGKAQFLN